METTEPDTEPEPRMGGSRVLLVNLKRLREERGLTLGRLAELSGVHPVSISRAENLYVRPYGITAHKLARALGVELEELTGEGGRR